MKNILLLVHDDQGQEARFQAAMDVARTLRGHLNCIDVSVLPVLTGDLWTTDGTAMLLEAERTRESANRGILEARLTRDEIPWSWVDVTGELEPCLQQAAKLNDLIVVNRRLDGAWPDMRLLASDLIVRSGKPILAVPGNAMGLNLAGHALIAWDGSAQADNALAAAIPLLVHASSVAILEVVDGKKRRVPPEDAASYLSRHGIEARVASETAGKLAIADVLIREVRQRKADYVVMGGYGHSRLVEALFGGVTRQMLSNSPVPLFIAH